MLHTIAARRLITRTGIIEYPVLHIHDGSITAIDSDPKNGAADTTLTTTFFDIHTHGAANHDVMEATPQALRCASEGSKKSGV